MSIGLLLLSLLGGVAGTGASSHDLVLVGVGRYAVFADRGSVFREPTDVVTLRALQVVEAEFRVGDTAYVGGWSNWRFDCAAQTADRLDFASLKADGSEGPTTPETAPPYPVVAGGDAAELAAVACNDWPGLEAAPSIDAAISLGRMRLAE